MYWCLDKQPIKVTYYNFPLAQDSFKLPRRDSSRDANIEMGMHQADASDNLKEFLKKVLFT